MKNISRLYRNLQVPEVSILCRIVNNFEIKVNNIRDCKPILLDMYKILQSSNWNFILNPIEVKNDNKYTINYNIDPNMIIIDIQFKNDTIIYVVFNKKSQLYKYKVLPEFLNVNIADVLLLVKNHMIQYITSDARECIYLSNDLIVAINNIKG